MSDETKDFAYYADKAEQAMQGPWSTAAQRERDIHRAELYVRLAAAAPQYIMCSAAKHGEVQFERNYRCALRVGHEGDHRTDDGVNFRL